MYTFHLHRLSLGARSTVLKSAEQKLFYYNYIDRDILYIPKFF